MQISYIKKSEIVKANRCDAEYFQPKYLELEKDLRKIKTKKLKDISSEIVNFGAYALCNQIEYQNSGVPFLRVQNIFENNISGDFVYVERNLSKNILYKSLVKKNQILMTITGKIGICAVFDEFDNLPHYTNSNQSIANITLKECNPYYVSTFLNCIIGKMQTKRVIISSVQPSLLLPQVKNLKIPILPETFQLEIEQLVKTAKEKQDKAKQNYQQAEQILLQELGLLNFAIEHQLTFTIRKKQVDSAKRFDAEYFQPKYDKIIKHIENYKGGFCLVKDFHFNKNNFYPKENENYFYIPLSKVSNSGEIGIPQKELGKNLPTRARRKVKQGEIILSSIEGSLETSALIQKEQENFIVSNGFYVFRSDKINSETLFIFVKSKIFIELLKKISKGAILGGYDLDSFEKIKIPLISQNIQKAIAELISESHHLRKESKALLETAKQKVETKIESLAS